MKNSFSVVLCCYNSITRLKPTLEHLFAQKYTDGFDWEIIVVDNASTDNTFDFAQQLYQSSGAVIDFSVVTEKVPGLSSARKKGISMSQYNYILFCDDDNWLCEDYLFQANKILNSNENIGVLGAYGDPVFEGETPPYFWENQYHALAVGSQWSSEGDITKERGVVYGAGMIVNKVAYDKLMQEYDFNFQSTGRIGNVLMSSEDHELCLAIKKIGYKIYWSKLLSFKHYMPNGRISIEYYSKLFKGFGLSAPMLAGYYIDKKNINSLKNKNAYLIARYFKNFLKSYFKLVAKGYFFKSDKDKYRDLSTVQAFYTNYGALLSMIKGGGVYKDNFLNSKIFKKTN
jgi:glycosyltransferase involved in cell wall biosynthesis